jgi:hypothetical protein
VTATAYVLRSGARGVRGALLAGLLGAAVLTVAYLSAEPSQLRTAVAVAVILLAGAIGIVWPERLLYGLVGWLVALGLVRRVLTLAAPAHGPDPLLLVEPVAVAILLVAAAQRGILSRRSALSTTVVVMTVLITASAANPKQGSLQVGAAGLLFLLVPTAGFWIGRTLCTDRVFDRTLKLLATLAIPVAVYGLVQTFVDFPRWDRNWILDVGQTYQALNVGAAVRPFSSLPSSAEYAYVVAVGLAVWLAYGVRGLRLPLTTGVVALLGTALVLESSRLVIFLCAAALVAMLVGRIRISAPLAAAVVLAGMLATSAVVGRVAPEYQPGATGALLDHQLQGISNPLDTKSSTLFIHLSLVTDGLRSAISHPAGLGAGTVSLAAGRFGGVGRQSEADPSNLAIAAGLPGLCAYLVLALLAFVRSYELARARRDALSLAALGIVTIVFLEWFNGGQYGIALLLWVTLGWVDRSWLRLNREQPS